MVRILIKKNYKKRLIIITKRPSLWRSLGGANHVFYSFNQWDYLSACRNFLLCSGRLFSAFALAVLSLLGLYELLRVLQMEKSSLAVVTYVATAVYYSMLCIYGGIDWLLLGLLIFMMLALLVIYVFSYPKLRIEDITKAVFVFLYVSVLFSYIARTRDLVAGNWLVWLIIISAWGSDTFAYLTGVLIGKHHFSELSPKKTVEGCIGGVVGAGLLGFCYAFFFPEYAAFTANPYIVFPLVTVIGR